MKKERKYLQSGFTLIETLMAMAIFTIGILGLFGMQTAVIKKNLSANTITTGATWASDQVERLIGLSYTHEFLKVTGDGSCNVLSDWQSWQNKVSREGGVNEPTYTVWWAVSNRCSLSTLPNSAPNQEQKPKHLRIVVTKNVNGQEVETAVFNYIKQNAN
jgi:prepilin-type N-terminal cleavage/methylation domain-containing protein